MGLWDLDELFIMQQPLVTIGIPVYNVGRFIGQTVKSVLKQTYTNFELIITDDGSTDDTVEVIRSFNDPRIILIVDGENHGISYRLNQQIDLSKGKYFVRMDGDDLMFPERVEKQVRYLEEHPDIEVLGAGAVIIDDDNEIIGMRQGRPLHLLKPEDVFKGGFFIHPTVIGKIEFFKKYKYDEDLSGVEDKDLWCRGLQDSKYAIIQEPLLFYRDPLKFKIRTYLNRKKKGRQQAIKRWSLFQDKRLAIRYIFNSFTKSAGSWLLSKLGKESWFIAKRNNIVKDKDYYHYLTVINEVIK